MEHRVQRSQRSIRAMLVGFTHRFYLSLTRDACFCVVWEGALCCVTCKAGASEEEIHVREETQSA